MRFRTIPPALIVMVLVAVFAGCSKEEPFEREPESTGSDPKVTLKVRYPQGTFAMTSLQDMDMKVKIKTKGNTHNQNVQMAIIVGGNLEVSAPDNAGNTTVVMETTRFRQEMKGGSMNMVLDTDDPGSLDSSPAGKIFKSMVGVRLTMHFDKDWNVTGVDGVEQMWDRMADTDPMARQVFEQLKKFGSDGFAQTISQYTFVSPKEPVGEGAVWYPKLKMPLPGMGTMSYETKCKLTKLEKTDAGQIATIEMTGAVTTESASDMNFGEGSFKFDEIDMIMKGHGKVNVETGLMVEQVYDIEGNMEMSVTAAGQSMTTSTNMSGTTKTTIKPVTER